MATKKTIRYNPNISIKENALRNGVSPDTIRKHIKDNLIDRRTDAKVSIVNEFRKYVDEHPDSTPYQVAKETRHSINTVKKYWEAVVGETEINSTIEGKAKTPKLTLRQKNNFYATHPSVVEDLLVVETFADEVLEPFCGKGNIAQVLEDHSYVVRASDIVDRGYGEVGDFFKVPFESGRYDIVTNPPYDDSLNDAILRCIRLCRNKVALLLPVAYLSGVNRFQKVFRDHPPARVYVFTNRVILARNANFDEYTGSNGSKFSYAWFVWDKSYNGSTVLKWIENTR